MENNRNVSGKNLIKKKIKNRLQTDWVIALTVSISFIFLKLFKEIDWSWIWLTSPIWILISIYVVVTLIAMTVYFISKSFKNNKDA